jgi:hypothetical protein
MHLFNCCARADASASNASLQVAQSSEVHWVRSAVDSAGVGAAALDGASAALVICVGGAGATVTVDVSDCTKDVASDDCTRVGDVDGAAVSASDLTCRVEYDLTCRSSA